MSIFIFCSCYHSSRELYKFDPSVLEDKGINLSKFADDIAYVPLDDSISLSGINPNHDPYFINDLIYLYDSNHGILVFTRSGKHLRKIGKKGRGPGEYVFGHTFTVDPTSGSVYVQDLNSIKVYSSSGKYIRSFSVKEFNGSIDFLDFFNNNLFVSFNLQYGNDFKYEWMFLDTLGNIISKKDRSIPIIKSNFLAGGGTFFHNGNLNLWNNFTDTVITFSDDFTCNPNFLFATGDFRLPTQYVDDPLKRLPEYTTFQQILETNRYLIVSYDFYRGKNSLVLIEKGNHKTYLTNWSPEDSGGFLNDLDGGLRFHPNSYLVENGEEYLIELKDAFRIKSYVSSKEFENAIVSDPEKKGTFKKIADSLKETDNPILMIVKLKK